MHMVTVVSCYHGVETCAILLADTSIDIPYKVMFCSHITVLTFQEGFPRLLVSVADPWDQSEVDCCVNTQPGPLQPHLPQQGWKQVNL